MVRALLHVLEANDATGVAKQRFNILLEGENWQHRRI